MTNRITGKLIHKDNRYMQFLADFWPDKPIGGNSGGNSGGSSGSTTVDPANPPTELNPNTIYNYGTLNTNTTFPQLKDSTTAGNVYCWFFYTGSTVPKIIMPTGLTWVGGSQPTWAANKYYEITVMNNVATCLEA